MRKTLLKNAKIVTSEKAQMGELLIEDGLISKISYYDNGQSQTAAELEGSDLDIIDLGGLCLMAGGIDAHVHFRDPGLTHKADIATESRAALLGGITSFMDMPNTNPPTTTRERLQEKLQHAAAHSAINYGFHIGATNDNAGVIQEMISDGTGSQFGAVKVFMGSSTGNMLVDDAAALRTFFGLKGKSIFIHSESEDIIRANMAAAKEKYGTDIPFSMHPEIRSRQACVMSTIKALETAMELGTRLHVLHVSTAEEVEMIRAAKLHNPEITAETSCNYLWFCDEDYTSMRGAVKCNPAIKSAKDRDALIQGVKNGVIDTIGSDHAPHLLSEKDKPYLSCPSGLPSIGQSFPVLLTLAARHEIPLTRVTALMSENISRILRIQKRGRLEEGWHADLVALDPEQEYVLAPEEIHSKCGWSPYTGQPLKGRIKMVWVNGQLAVRDGAILDEALGQALVFGQDNNI